MQFINKIKKHNHKLMDNKAKEGLPNCSCWNGDPRREKERTGRMACVPMSVSVCQVKDRKMRQRSLRWIQSMSKAWSGQRGPWVRKCQWPLEAENELQMTGNKEKETSVLQPRGTEFCQQPEWLWKWILPRKESTQPTPWFWPHETHSCCCCC